LFVVRLLVAFHISVDNARSITGLSVVVLRLFSLHIDDLMCIYLTSSITYPVTLDKLHDVPRVAGQQTHCAVVSCFKNVKDTNSS